MNRMHLRLGDFPSICTGSLKTQKKLNIFRKNREISILMMKKKPTARLTLLQEATESSKLGKTKTNTKQKKQKTKICGMNKSASLTLVQGTVNSSMYDSDLTTTTSPLTSSAPYSA
jgi:hypothetical protein